MVEYLPSVRETAVQFSV